MTKSNRAVISVLLVDDDEDSFVLARSALAVYPWADYQIEWVARPEQALELLLQNRHDVCLLDYQLGARTGLEVLRDAKAQGSRVPAILLTNHDSSALDREAMEAGTVDFLGKDALATRELERSIRYAVENARHLSTMESQARLLQAVIENIGEGIMIADPEGRTLQVNGAFTRITGFANHEMVGLPSELYSEEVRQILLRTGEWRSDRVATKKDGTSFDERVIVRLVGDNRGRPSHFVSLHSDVTRQKERERRLHEMAHHDGLTGLPNRLLFQDRVSQAIFQASRHHRVVAVLYIDLDNFKPINDQLGHEMGDHVLKTAARRLQGCLRQEDTAARLGGDEFGVVLVSVEGPSGVQTVAEKILAAVQKPLEGPDGQPIDYRLGASIGASLYPEDGATLHELLERADEAMYVVKRSQKNSYALFGSLR